MIYKLVIFSLFITSLLAGSCRVDEARNPLGPNRCSNSNQCSGDRTCSDWGWCQGTSGCSSCNINEANNPGGANRCSNND